tara:strand:+ start:1718 stop:2632 length:915 start_codon:yes stop_codon:yes gene_type:complete
VSFKKTWFKVFNKEKYYKHKHDQIRKSKEKLYKEKVEFFLEKIDNSIASKKGISFLHSGHLGDIVNSLPLIKEISKTKKCNLFIRSEKIMPKHAQDKLHPFGKFYLSKKAANMILPLLKKQNYLTSVASYNNEEIDINLDLFRDLPINFNLDSIRWYFHLTGFHYNLNQKYLEADDHKTIKNKVVIIRSSRRKNFLINYRFLNKFDDIIFLGLKNEHQELKKEVPNLKFYDCKDFLEMAEIIKSSKVFIGNLSFGYTLAEGLKVPRLLESNPEFPLVYPNGDKGYDFYFQNHFEMLFEKLYSNK